MTVHFKLVCCTCGKSTPCEADDHPMFAFEVCMMANQVGMIGFLDPDNGRGLVFCSKDCLDFQRTKSGRLRRRLLKKEAA